MEQTLIVRCTRMRALMRAWNRDHPGPDPKHFPENGDPENLDFEEVDLRAGVGDGAVDVFRHIQFTFDELWELANRKIVWMGPDLFFKAKGKVVSIAAVCQSNGFDLPIISVGMSTTHYQCNLVVPGLMQPPPATLMYSN
jgi:hypothetical protein